MENSNKLLWFGAIVGVSLVVAAIVVASTFLNIKKMDDVITVSGSSTQHVTSDTARWTASFSRSATVDNLKAGYAQMKQDEKTVGDFLISQGFDKSSFEISPVFMNEIYKSNDSAPKEYNLVQNVEVKSNDVTKLKTLAKNSDKIAETGIVFSANPVEYNYSQLPAVRVSLLPAAIQDAKNRANIIAQSSGKTVGAIKVVTMGVVQVMPAGTVDVSDYGSYDTSSIDKDVMITVKTVFSLK
jgi:hypothetical protein